MKTFDSFIWVEKYRPTTLEDCIVPETLKTQFREFLKQKQIPNLLLYSQSPGTGKTTVARALCHDLGCKPLFINASLNNSIDDIRELVIQFATTQSFLDDCPIKVIILDEAERLSTAAQESLKGLIEHVHKNCRFILTTNNKTKIVEPLRSRCAEIDFVYTSDQQKQLSSQMYKRILEILDNERIGYNKSVVAHVVQKFVPDNRKIINLLQQHSSNINEGLLGIISAGEVSTLVEAMKNKDYPSVKQFVFNEYERLGIAFYRKLFDILEKQIKDQSIPEMIMILAEEQKSHGIGDVYVHMLGVCVKLMCQLEFK